MKSIAMLSTLLTLTWTVLAECPKGYDTYEGACAAMSAPANSQTPGFPVSEEKAPDDKMPSYEREGIKIGETKPGVEKSTDVANDTAAERNQK